MKQKPTTESSIDEIHRIRREISDRFGGDLAAIAEDAARRQAASNRSVWQRNAKPYQEREVKQVIEESQS